MFGVLYLFGKLIHSTIADVKIQYEDYKCKQKAINNNQLTYDDSDNVKRFVNNDHLVYSHYDDKADELQYIDLKDDKIIQRFPNVEKIKALEKRIESCKKSGRTVCIYKLKDSKVDNMYPQNCYIDVDNKKKYVVRKIRDRFYYIDMLTGSIVRETDMSKRWIHKGQGVLSEELDKRIDIYSSISVDFPEASYDYQGCKFYD